MFSKNGHHLGRKIKKNYKAKTTVLHLSDEFRKNMLWYGQRPQVKSKKKMF